ncbi:MAG: glucokinase [Pseudomonadota bacterium]
MSQRVLVGDIGGTSVRLGLASSTKAGVVIDGFSKVPGDQFQSFAAAVDAYLKQQSIQPFAALFAVAGPVHQGAVKLTNRPWTISAQQLENEFQLEAAHLANDFAAMARSVPELAPDAFHPIKDGTPCDGAPILVIGPGTGLGMATLIGDCQTGWQVLSGEGGHSVYAPRTDLEWQMVDRLKADHGYVSNELVCSGAGLPAIHRALADVFGVSYEPLAPAAVLDAADAGDVLCLAICETRARAVLGLAGDIALSIGARGGVVLAGGVAQRLVGHLAAEPSLSRFTERGPMSSYMRSIPIRLLTSELAPLIGAASLYFDRLPVSPSD